MKRFIRPRYVAAAFALVLLALVLLALVARWIYPHAALQSEHPWTEGEVYAMLRRNVPPGSSVAQVQAYFVQMDWLHEYDSKIKGNDTLPPLAATTEYFAHIYTSVLGYGGGYIVYVYFNKSSGVIGYHVDEYSD